jgi:hypothetical protein
LKELLKREQLIKALKSSFLFRLAFLVFCIKKKYAVEKQLFYKHRLLDGGKAHLILFTFINFIK